MGTDNPATIIIGLNWVYDYNITDGIRHSVTVSVNDTVLYNLNTHALGTSWLEKNPATITYMKLVTSLLLHLLRNFIFPRICTGRISIRCN